MPSCVQPVAATPHPVAATPSPGGSPSGQPAPSSKAQVRSSCQCSAWLLFGCCMPLPPCRARGACVAQMTSAQRIQRGLHLLGHAPPWESPFLTALMPCPLAFAAHPAPSLPGKGAYHLRSGNMCNQLHFSRVALGASLSRMPPPVCPCPPAFPSSSYAAPSHPVQSHPAPSHPGGSMCMRAWLRMQLCANRTHRG